MDYQIAILAIFAMFALMEARHGRLFHKKTEVDDDWRVELFGTGILFLLTQPLVLFTAGLAMAQIAPGHKDALIGLPIVLQLALFLVLDDMMQYWWHRLSHSLPWLYNLHRAHHNAAYMSVRIIYRNNVFYFLLMPSLWFSGVLIYLGLGWVYAGYLILKLLVVSGAHSEWKWDSGMYNAAKRYPVIEPLVWVLERTISTPSTHSAHHGLSYRDGVTNYKGNYGNLLFLWDVIFGTAKITRRYPAKYGVEGMPYAGWKQQLFWPFVKTKHGSNRRT